MPEETPELVDLHSHLLPGVDDGSASPQQSAAVIDTLRSTGVREICLTPHVRLSETYGPRRAELLAKFASAYERLAATVPPETMRFWSGAEVMIDEPPGPRHDLGLPLTLGESDAILIEFPTGITSSAVAGTVKALRDRNLVPLIAHPERYACCTLEAVVTWRAEGAWIQVDATTAAFGQRGRADRARILMQFGVVDLLAGDNHGDKRSLGAAYHRLTELGHGPAAAQLCSAGPKALLSNTPKLPAVSILLEEPLPKSPLDHLRDLLPWKKRPY